MIAVFCLLIPRSVPNASKVLEDLELHVEENAKA